MINKKPIAIVPARGGSKRIKLKNIVLFKIDLNLLNIKSAINAKYFLRFMFQLTLNMN